MTDEAGDRQDTRVWMYRLGADGEVESHLFDAPEDIPEGENWQDTPAGLAETEPRRRGGRRRSGNKDDGDGDGAE